MAKKKKHWSAILKVLGACRSGRKYAQGKKSLATAWRDCKNGTYLEWLCCELAMRFGRKFHMFGADGDFAITKIAQRYFAEFSSPPKKGDDLRRFYPKPPRIPKKLLKEAGLIA